MNDPTIFETTVFVGLLLLLIYTISHLYIKLDFVFFGELELFKYVISNIDEGCGGPVRPIDEIDGDDRLHPSRISGEHYDTIRKDYSLFNIMRNKYDRFTLFTADAGDFVFRA